MAKRSTPNTALLDVMDEARPAQKFQRIEPPRPRREMVEDFADDEDTAAFLRAAGKNRRLRRSIIPQTRWGRIAAAAAVVAVLGATAATIFYSIRYITHDERFRIADSASIALDGNSHVTRSQLLSIFGEDVDRNIFHLPLSQRQADLERLPWVEHAQIMRLLPNKIRVHITERTPVAFVRQGSNIGLVDANGVLLDIPPDAPGNPSYSFPVVTGINASEPASTRASRMKSYMHFIKELDGGGQKVSSEISEIDLSDPEDIRALVPEQNHELLVHFGQENFLDRFQRVKDHAAEWLAQYPKLAGVDTRYDRQFVLQMPSGSTGPTDAAASPEAAKPNPVPAEPAKAEVTPAAKPGVKAPVKPVAGKPATPAPSAATTAKAPSAKAPATKTPAGKTPAIATAKKSATKDTEAETAKKVAAIHAWMAQREKLRQQQAAAPASAAGTPASAAGKGPVQYHPTQVQ